jgi:hypothetical protein
MICRSKWPTVAALVAIGAFAFVASSCGSGDNNSTPPPTAVTPPPPPTEPPPSSGGSGASNCALGEGSDTAECGRGSTELYHYVDGAIRYVIDEHPEYFDLTVESGPGTGQFRILQKELYFDAVLERIQSFGICAERADYDYEIIQVKETNEFSEDFDIYLSDGFIRVGGAYRQTCTPAAFPVPRPPWAPPPGIGCGKPYPPPIGRFNVKIHFKNSEYWTLDSTPLVGHDVAYCRSIGFTDNRSLCPVRPEGHPERLACEEWAVGYAADTGRVGPTWTKDDQHGALCTGAEMGCTNAPSQYQLYVYKSGEYWACAENRACGRKSVDKK